MRMRLLALATALMMVVSLAIACNNKKDETIANQKAIEEQLKLAGLDNVTIHLDKSARVARLDGSVKDQDEKAHAERIVRETAPRYTITNNLSVQSDNASGQAQSGQSSAQTAGK